MSQSFRQQSILQHFKRHNKIHKSIATLLPLLPLKNIQFHPFTCPTKPFLCHQVVPLIDKHNKLTILDQFMGKNNKNLFYNN
jgi:hypothetical protein